MVNVKGTYCWQVYFYRCVGQVVGQEWSKAHESLLIGRREGAIAVKATIPAAKVNIATLSREINTPSGGRESLGEQKLTPLGQHVWSAASSDSGITQGVRSAWGARRRKRWNWKRERESATGLAKPRTEDAVNINEWRIASKDKWRSNPIKWWSREEPDLSTATTDLLSHRNSTCRETHWEPHKEAATTMGKSFLYVIDNDCCSIDQAPQNHLVLKIAP